MAVIFSVLFLAAAFIYVLYNIVQLIRQRRYLLALTRLLILCLTVVYIRMMFIR